MFSDVQIANMALSHIGKTDKIESLNENGAEATQCKLWYGASLMECLEAYDWGFARIRGFALALDSDAPPLDWFFRYQYPVDCAKVRSIVNPLGHRGNAIPYEISVNSQEARTILTNMQSAQLNYTKALKTTTAFSTTFVAVLSRCIAMHIAFKLTGKQSIADNQTKIYQSLLRSAPANDANESVQHPQRDAEWIRGRHYRGVRTIFNSNGFDDGCI